MELLVGKEGNRWHWQERARGAAGGAMQTLAAALQNACSVAPGLKPSALCICIVLHRSCAEELSCSHRHDLVSWIMYTRLKYWPAAQSVTLWCKRQHMAMPVTHPHTSADAALAHTSRATDTHSGIDILRTHLPHKQQAIILLLYCARQLGDRAGATGCCPWRKPATAWGGRA